MGPRHVSPPDPCNGYFQPSPFSLSLPPAHFLLNGRGDLAAPLQRGLKPPDWNAPVSHLHSPHLPTSALSPDALEKAPLLLSQAGAPAHPPFPRPLTHCYPLLLSTCPLQPPPGSLPHCWPLWALVHSNSQIWLSPPTALLEHDA